jgi:hypothetical protein
MSSQLPPERDVLREIQELERRLHQLEGALAQQPTRTRGWCTVLTFVSCVLVGVGSLLGVSGVLAADGACPNQLPFCFAAGAPARASEINHNFAQLLEWLESKVGAVDSGDVSVAGNVQLKDADGNTVVSLDGTDPQRAALTIRTPDGTIAASQDFAFSDTGDNRLRLMNGASTSYADLSVRDLYIEGTMFFTRGPCRNVMEASPDVFWVGCGDGEYVAAIDFDANDDNTGGVRCCKF